MTKDETIGLITKIRACFPAWSPKVSPRELIDEWYDRLRKYEYAAVKDMLDAYVEADTTGYAPSVGQLIPKNFSNGFKGRIYSHADFVEMEREALRQTLGVGT